MITLSTKQLDLTLRSGTIDDMPLLHAFIHEMMVFEKLPFHASEADLREAFFGSQPAAHTLLAFDAATAQPVGYIVYLYNFSTMLGKRGLWLEDLYVKPEYRGKGAGKALMNYLKSFAAEQGCGRFEWMVLDWNEDAIGFYKGFGARMLDEWRVCRMVIE